MNLDRYTYFTNEDFLDYEFYSVGPKGSIKKVVRYMKIRDDEPVVYNLGFGDILENTERINDSVVSDNNDRDMILATVASTIIDFTNHYKDCFVYAVGSNSARTRLYQMGINRVLNEIWKDFKIYGLKENAWREFQRNVNYDAFLARRR